MLIPTYTMYIILWTNKCYTWHHVINKISLMWYIPGIIHTAMKALSLRLSISMCLHNILNSLQ